MKLSLVDFYMDWPVSIKLKNLREYIISAANVNGIDLPNSCCSGVCTSCASRILEGSVEQEDAMGLNDDLREKGFALLCVAYPKSDLHIVIGDQVEDDLYNDQFGKYQKWN